MCTSRHGASGMRSIFCRVIWTLPTSASRPVFGHSLSVQARMAARNHMHLEGQLRDRTEACSCDTWEKRYRRETGNDSKKKMLLENRES